MITTASYPFSAAYRVKGESSLVIGVQERIEIEIFENIACDGEGKDFGGLI
jgi:hypothetical protein